jgi:hypothetical protein
MSSLAAEAQRWIGSRDAEFKSLMKMAVAFIEGRGILCGKKLLIVN